MQVKDSPNLGRRVKKESCIDKGTEGTFRIHGDGVQFRELSADDKAFVRARTDCNGRWNDRNGIVDDR